MNVWAIANQKGGVGKTTTTINLAGLLAAAGRETLVIDLDPHGSLTSYLGYDPDDMEGSVYQLYRGGSGKVEQVVRKTAIKKLSLMPASSAMATLDRQLGAEEGKGLVLAHALQRLGGRFQHVLIDCPPLLGVLMVNALAASERLLIPVQTEFLALKGLERMVRTLNMITQARGQALPYTIVPTMYDQRTRAAQESLRVLRETYPYNIWEHVIPVDTRFREASRRGKPLTLLSTRSRGAIAYRKLLMHLIMSQGAGRSRQASVAMAS